MRFPNSGRESNHCKCSRSAATRPTTRTPGRRSVACFVIPASVSSVPTSVSCIGNVPLYTTEQALKECLPYYTELYAEMKG